VDVFGETLVPAALREVWLAGRCCPRCSAAQLRPVCSLNESHGLCESCGHCWRVEHGQLRPVDPLSCQGCATRSKQICLTVLQDTCPQFGPAPESPDAFT